MLGFAVAGVVIMLTPTILAGILCKNVNLGMIWIDSAHIIPKFTREYHAFSAKPSAYFLSGW
jgi:hypothetical protein